ncbi:hypothetical protein DPMN_187940 [Dreissena polymorpha]|uniref:Uncharacterized protein n=1 Tax=Dreissena polymorpha TaxID=45954 RepID=A0A9D4DS03_DREPO|nr:hypothetical protein DPMN_187940 [Dreissena polymorpha]
MGLALGKYEADNIMNTTKFSAATWRPARKGHHQRRLGRQLTNLREGGIGDKGRPGRATTRVVLASVGRRQRTVGRARVIFAAVSKIRWTPPEDLRSGESHPCRGGVDTGSRT